jgi:hypothetical protein
VKVPFSLHYRQHLLLVFLMVAILTGVMWNLSVALICISFMAGMMNIFVCVSQTSSFEKVLFSSIAHFFIGLLIFGEFSFLSSLYILIISPLSNYS